MILKYLCSYLVAASVVGAVAFYIDKRKANKNEWRIPEKTLHLFELMGGVVGILLLMYFIRHKNQKSSYYSITYAILLLWILIVYFVIDWF